MKKLLAIVLAVAMLATMSVTAFAAAVSTEISSSPYTAEAMGDYAITYTYSKNVSALEDVVSVDIAWNTEAVFTVTVDGTWNTTTLQWDVASTGVTTGENTLDTITITNNGTYDIRVGNASFAIASDVAAFVYSPAYNDQPIFTALTCESWAARTDNTITGTPTGAKLSGIDNDETIKLSVFVDAAAALADDCALTGNLGVLTITLADGRGVI